MIIINLVFDVIVAILRATLTHPPHQKLSPFCCRTGSEREMYNHLRM